MLGHVDPLLAALAAEGGGPATTYSIVESSDPAHRFTLDADDERIAAVPQLRRMVAGLFWHLNRTAVVHADADLVLLHAGAVVHDGAVVVLPVASGGGKSTLVAALVRHGMGYLSDEIAALTAALDALPYPKPISLKPGSWPLLAELEPPSPPGPADDHDPWQVAPAAIRSDAVATGGRLAAVVFPLVVPGAPASLEPIAPADALAALVTASFRTGPAAPAALPRLRAIVDAVPCSRLTYGELDGAVDLIHRTVTN